MDGETRVIMEDRTRTIQNPSHELFLEMIRTLPLEPEYSSICLYADGIPYPKDNVKDSRKDYLKECRDRKIIPYTHLNFDYDDNRGVFPTQIQDIIQTSDHENIISDIIAGGRYHALEFENGFKKFIKIILPQSLEAGYNLERGEIWLTTMRLTGYNEGTYADTDIIFENKYGNRNYLKLRMGKHISPEDEHTVERWFAQLPSKCPRPFHGLPLFTGLVK